ncbi:V-set and immunoglobulin domain-containing protein 1-like isoform X1 [Pectinophora gossypiella]|nr:V-set and immunoglobulin domain-containing protein 1-like isoform X1 [Pectinophora gossypiella]
MPPALALLLCLSLVAANQVSITEFSVPDTAKVGDDVELVCRYNLEGKETSLFYVKWWWTPVDAPTRLLYQRIGHHEPQSSIHGVKVKDNDTIQLVNLQPNDSGRYECEVNNVDEIRRSQDLIVYTPGSGPQLNVSTVADGPDDQDVQVFCEATDVAPEPELTISVDGKVVPVADLVLSDSVDGQYSIAANLTLEDIEAGSEVRCELFYTNRAVNHEPYVAVETYQPSGAELTTTEAFEDSTESEATPSPTDGSGDTLLRNSWLLLAIVAALAHLLVRTDRSL